MGGDPITGALHQAKNLRERLAEVGTSWSSVPTQAVAAELRKNDGEREEWKNWQRVFDRVDAEENILSALEVRACFVCGWCHLLPPLIPLFLNPFPLRAFFSLGAGAVCACCSAKHKGG